jgi:hypothetical protein
VPFVRKPRQDEIFLELKKTIHSRPPYCSVSTSIQPPTKNPARSRIFDIFVKKYI